MTPLEKTQDDALLAIKALLTQPYNGDNLPRDLVAIVDAVAKPSSPDEAKLSSFRAKAGWRFRDKGMTNHEWTEEDWRDWYELIGQALYKIAERKHGDDKPVEHLVAVLPSDSDFHKPLVDAVVKEAKAFLDDRCTCKPPRVHVLDLARCSTCKKPLP